MRHPKLTKRESEFVGNHDVTGLPVYKDDVYNKEHEKFVQEYNVTSVQGPLVDDINEMDSDEEEVKREIPDVINSDFGFYMMFGFNADSQLPSSKNLNLEMHNMNEGSYRNGPVKNNLK